MTIRAFAHAMNKSVKTVQKWVQDGYIPGASIENDYIPDSARIPYTQARAKNANAIYCSIVKAANERMHVVPKLYGISQEEFDGYIRRLTEAGFVESRVADGVTYYDATLQVAHSSRAFILAVIEAGAKGLASGVTEACISRAQEV